MHALLRFSVAAALGLLMAAAPRKASASPTYPGFIKTDLSLTYDLGTTHCTICHENNLGGVGTVVQPFGKAMKTAGLVLEDPNALQAALTTLDTKKTDSDCDGTPDVEQIKQGRDPNTGAYIDGSGRPTPVPDGGTEGCGGGTEIAAFGCGAQLAPGAAGSAGAWGAGVLAAGMLAASLRRRRDRTTPPQSRIAGPR